MASKRHYDKGANRSRWKPFSMRRKEILLPPEPQERTEARRKRALENGRRTQTTRRVGREIFEGMGL